LSKSGILKQKNFIKIVVTGPESSGKTALAEAMANALGTVRSPEFARYYLAHLGRPYQRNDLKTIGWGQKIWENWYAQQLNNSTTQQFLVCDTDWTVLHIWETYRFENYDAHQSPIPNPQSLIWQKGYGAFELADLYLLCAPDFPWQPDPLREHPEERDTLFVMYENLLRKREANFVTLFGEHGSRLQTALAAIHKLF
jgi:nicotinamide riboside kinase